MKYYIEITLLPSEEIPLYFLWEKLYSQLHLALAEIKYTNNTVSAGVSFPNYDAGLNQLGCKLRLFANNSEILDKLNLSKWLSRLSDYTHITSIRDVPDKLEGYAYFKRIQPKSSNARLARRKAKRENIGYEQALAYFDKRKEQYSRAPFIRIKSHSSGRSYRLIIACEKTNDLQATGGYSTYGLSSVSTVPIF